ncbi:MAG TPA: amidase [Burkholderiales bacterium]|jgi:amidase|nr:amidase [Burkholderiales bacterium]
MNLTSKKASPKVNELTAIEIAAAVEAGETTCEAVVRACLEHIAVREPQVQAWHYLNPENAIGQAIALDKSGRRGPLIGVPFGIKDIIDTVDMPTEYGSPIYRGNQPRNDAACVALGRKAGGLLMGKTVTTEFANRFPGKTKNPFDPARTPGGSSSGSAAAVASHMVPLAIGTQTTGSTIRPASFCGVFGYRPTWGDLRCSGVREAAGSLDTLGLLARSIDDIALYRDVLLGIQPQRVPAHTGALRVGFCRTHVWPQVEPHTQQLLEDAAQKLARAGLQVRDVELPAHFARLTDAHLAISSFEFSRNFTYEIEHHWEEISTMLRENRLKSGLECSFERYSEARALAAQCRRDFVAVVEDYDVLLTASATGEAPIGLNTTGNANNCLIWTTLHVPSVTMPVFKGPNGLPVGAQIIGKANGDRALFAAAQRIYDALA